MKSESMVWPAHLARCCTCRTCRTRWVLHWVVALACCCCMFNLRAKVTNHGFQSSKATQELGLLLCRGVRIVCIATAARNATGDGKDTLGLVPGARSARMASIAAHFAPAAIDAAPHLQTFCLIGVIGTTRFRRLQRHHFGRRIGRVSLFGVI